MKAMKKISSAGIVAAMIIVFYVYASFLSTAHKQDAGKQLDLQVTASCVITEPKMGDAKLISDKIVSGTDGHMIVFQENGSVFREYPDIPLYWLYVYENERMVVAAGGENELRLVQMNDDWTVKSNQAINIRGGRGNGERSFENRPNDCESRGCICFNLYADRGYGEQC